MSAYFAGGVTRRLRARTAEAAGLTEGLGERESAFGCFFRPREEEAEAEVEAAAAAGVADLPREVAAGATASAAGVTVAALDLRPRLRQ